MGEQSTFWSDVWAAAMASTVFVGAAWGAAGGATSAMAISVKPRDAIRQIILGALIAGGTGSFGASAFAYWSGLPVELIAVMGAGASGSYFAGVFGPAIVEVLLKRIRGGSLPLEGKDNEKAK